VKTLRERFKKMLIVKNLKLREENKILRRLLKNVPTYDKYKKRIQELELQLRNEKLKNKEKNY